MIRLSHVSRSYRQQTGLPVPALQDFSLTLAEGSMTAVTGPSGCGKSTLLHLLGALDRPDTGEVEVSGIPLHLATERQRTRYRRETVGIVFQFFHLLPGMTLLENVALPLILAGAGKQTASGKAAALLELAGLASKSARLPQEVSGGELQRAAVARALVHQPRLLLADEPTGNLDSENAARVMELFHTVHRSRMATILLVTHSPEIAVQAPGQVALADGRIASQSGPP
ncbi:MAG: ABC transporter ATP-binding protein [Verrucomicrobiaceae bacterium]|nr:MAG: ABC transporter ATP-binding protein [Verrucomicrobiaceae bacterium]